MRLIRSAEVSLTMNSGGPARHAVRASERSPWRPSTGQGGFSLPDAGSSTETLLCAIIGVYRCFILFQTFFE